MGVGNGQKVHTIAVLYGFPHLCIQALCDTRYHCIKMHTENISVKFVIRSIFKGKKVYILNFGLMHIRFGNIGTFRYGIRTMQHILE